MDFCTRILKSLCGYITARPPITIFVLCIGGIAMSFIILSYHIENHNAINYEASKVNKKQDIHYKINLTK